MKLDSSRQAYKEAPDEQARMGQIAGVLWMVAAVIAAVGAFLPGADHGPIGWVLAVCAFVFLYGLGSATRMIHWDRASIRTHALGTAATLPVIGLSLYLMGNAHAYIEPLLVVPLFYSAFFFPRPLAWTLTGMLLVVAALPLLTDPEAIDHAFLPRYVSLCAGFLAATWVIVGLRERLDAAEQRQREIAGTDPLTGIANRRTFERVMRDELKIRGDPALARRTGDDSPLALLILDLDGFKGVNDRFGHPTGDRILCELTETVSAKLRSGDTLARIGGDEFAVIAPGADDGRAALIAQAIETSLASADGEALPRASAGWAIYPDDGQDLDALLNAADARMLKAKSQRRQQRTPTTAEDLG